MLAGWPWRFESRAPASGLPPTMGWAPSLASPHAAPMRSADDCSCCLNTVALWLLQRAGFELPDWTCTFRLLWMQSVALWESMRQMSMSELKLPCCACSALRAGGGAAGVYAPDEAGGTGARAPAGGTADGEYGALPHWLSTASFAGFTGCRAAPVPAVALSALQERGRGRMLAARLGADAALGWRYQYPTGTELSC